MNLPAKKNEIERRKPDVRPPWCEKCNKQVTYFQVSPIELPPVQFWCSPILSPPVREDFYLQWNYEVQCHGETIRGVVGDDGKLFMTEYRVELDEWGR